jgi:hypothetical protein
MKTLLMLTIAGLVISVWCSTGHTDRLYTWEDNKGVTHISKEPPPPKTKLIDTMDYTVSPAQENQPSGQQVSNEGESPQPQPGESGFQKKIKAPGETETAEQVDDDVYYDSDGGRYTRRAIRHEIKEGLENRKESGSIVEKPQRRQTRRR